MVELLNIGQYGFAIIVGIATFYFSTKFGIKALKKDVKINNEKIKAIEVEIKELTNKLELKASKDMVNAIKNELKESLNEIKIDIKEINQSILKLLSTK